MSAALIKICGITSAAALDAAIAARAGHVGFNFHEPSPRFIATHALAALGRAAAGRIGRIGLFVDASDGFIAQRVETGALDALQLHGSETAERAAALRTRFGLPVWKALPIASSGDVARARDYIGAADLILFDAKTPRGALPGGMGLTFDWSLLAGWNHALPWGLAGGLTPDNVAAAIRATGTALVDTSSGVETAPGVKDAGLIAAFCVAARGG
ncbi:MAG: phosphoribosylanthranilate isomerase [Proteobacteria bacterium]|nr:phosphoribosylanthranilate isomerase [Pseudomonadota bacterium]